jgi:TonB family protein
MRAMGKNRSRASWLASVATHAVLIALLMMALHTRHVRPVFVESRCCSVALYWSPSAAPGSPKPKHKSRHLHSAPLPVTTTQPMLASAPAVTPQTATAQTGMTSPQRLASMGIGVGDENAEPALPVYRPAPDVADRSLLPQKEQKVVVEVEISEVGDVISEKLVQGLGNALDQIVLQTVKGWRFQPATLNGTAVASVEQLVFPFNQNYRPEQSPS